MIQIYNIRQQLRDIRVVGLITFLVIVLLVSWSGVKAIQTNYDLQKQVATLQQQNALSALKNTNLRLQNEYYNSNQYLELSARQNFGLGAPGETELLVPKNVAMSHLVNMPGATNSSANKERKSWVDSNLTSWLDFFFHRQSSNNVKIQ